MLKPHIVILGAGFGGTYVAKYLAPAVKRDEIQVTIVNKTNYFLFTPLLHEVATGSLSPMSVAEPVREIFEKTDIAFCQGTVQAVNLNDRRVHIKANDSRLTLPYDFLVIATGAESNYYGIAGAEQFALPLKNLMDAARIRARIIDAFERAVAVEDQQEKKSLLSFAIVGGGPTGVETAAELAEFVNGIAERYYREIGHAEARVSLVHTGAELLQQFPLALRKIAEERLRKNGVELVMGKSVAAVNQKGLALSDGSSIVSSTVIWAAGVKAVIPEFEGNAPALVSGRLAADEFFRLGGNERAFVLGDAACYAEKDQAEKDAAGAAVPVPMLAQAAVAEAKIVANNLLASINGKKLKSFHFRQKGNLASVGQWFAVGEIFSLPVHGWFAWWLWRTIYLFKFASWRKRIRIGFEWAIGLFYSRDLTKLN